VPDDQPRTEFLAFRTDKITRDRIDRVRRAMPGWSRNDGVNFLVTVALAERLATAPVDVARAREVDTLVAAALRNLHQEARP
jgi:hypothetical protein